MRAHNEEAGFRTNEFNEQVAEILDHMLSVAMGLFAQGRQFDRHGRTRIRWERAMGTGPYFRAQLTHECHAFSSGTADATIAGLITLEWHHAYRHVPTICSHSRNVPVLSRVRDGAVVADWECAAHCSPRAPTRVVP